VLKGFEIKILLFLVISILVMTSCSSENGNLEDIKINESVVDEYSEDIFYTFTDALDNFIVLHEKPDKVIALAGSYAEIWLLSGGKLIGVTDDVISERKINISANTKVIGTIKDPNLEEILYLEPDFVLLSPDMESHIQISETFKKVNITYAFFKVEQFEDYLQMLNICTDITMSKDNRYIVLPKDLFHYKPNARWGESYEYLAKIIYPEIFK